LFSHVITNLIQASTLASTRVALLPKPFTSEEMTEVVGRIAEPADIAGTVAYLLSDDAAGVNA